MSEAFPETDQRWDEPAMIDTHVLSYALIANAEEMETAAARQRVLNSQRLVARHSALWLSAAVVVEVARKARTAEAADKLRSLVTRFRQVDLPVGASWMAAKLLRERRGTYRDCRKCGALRPKKKNGPVPTCTVCGVWKGIELKRMDAVIVAHASVEKDIVRLYSYDGGVLHLGEFAADVEVLEPPVRSGELFLEAEDPSQLETDDEQRAEPADASTVSDSGPAS